jgi:hypothetical protein
MPASKHGSEQYIKQFFTTDAVAARPTSWTLALHAGNPGTGDANEVVDDNYARQPATFAASDKGSYWEGANVADVEFPAASATADYIATHYTIRDGVSGECLGIAALPVPIPVVEGGVITIPAGMAKVRGI